MVHAPLFLPASWLYGSLPTALTLNNCVTTALVWGEENNSGDNNTATTTPTVLGEPVFLVTLFRRTVLLGSLIQTAIASPCAASNFAQANHQSRRFVLAMLSSAHRQERDGQSCFG
jgi:hypothetical protein